MLIISSGGGYKSVSCPQFLIFTGKGNTVLERLEKYCSWRIKVNLVFINEFTQFPIKLFKFFFVVKFINGLPFSAIKKDFIYIFANSVSDVIWKWKIVNKLFEDFNIKYNSNEFTVYTRRELDEFYIINKDRWVDWEDKFISIINCCDFTDIIKVYYLRIKVIKEVRAVIAN